MPRSNHTRRYLWLYVIVLKSFMVYVSDIFSAITMLTTQNWSNEIFKNCVSGAVKNCVAIPFNTGKWLFVGCIIFSFLLVRSSPLLTRAVGLIASVVARL